MFATQFFQKALTSLYEKRKKYSGKDIVSAFSYDFSLAYGNIILSLNNHLRSECQRVGESSYQNLANALAGNLQDYPFTPFIQREFSYMEGYKPEFKEIMAKYSDPIINDNYKIDDRNDWKILEFRFKYLLIPFVFTISQNPDKYHNEIELFNNLIKPVVWNKFKPFMSVFNELEQTFIGQKSELTFAIIEFLERFEKGVKILKPIEPAPVPIVPSPDIPAPQPTPTKSSVKKRKAKIPSAVRIIVWNTYIGSDKSSGKCLVCNTEKISPTNFECGHIHAESLGGETTIQNLRPICGHCNKSIGGQNMEEFMKRYGIKKPKNWNGI
jgi:hypothetical protein